MTVSFDRIPTTHTGSLPRPQGLREMLAKVDRGDFVDTDAFETACDDAVTEAVRLQCEVGLDIINDGEQSKVDFASYIRQRLHGYDGEAVSRVTSLEARDFPEVAGAVQLQQPCTTPISWKNFAATERDIARLKGATLGLPGKLVFINSVSPGTLANINPNRYYATRENYLSSIVDVMRREYEACAAAGFVVQLDSPDLAQHSSNFPDLSLKEWLKIVAQNIEALNDATSTIPVEQIRVHVCWGANDGPHNHDTELRDIIGLLLKLRTGAIGVVCANGRHAHEWSEWRRVKLPSNMRIIPGVIDSTTNIVEHPETVAERLVRLGSVVGRDNVIAGVDCGFGTSGIAAPRVHSRIVWAKFRSLVAGARIASDTLWRGS